MNEVAYVELRGTAKEKIDQITRIRYLMVSSYLETDYAKELFKELDKFLGIKIYSIFLEFDSDTNDEGLDYQYCSTIKLGIEVPGQNEIEVFYLDEVLNLIMQKEKKGIKIWEDLYLDEEHEVRDYIVDNFVTTSFDMDEITNCLGNYITRPEGV